MGFLYSKADVKPSVPLGTRAVEGRNRRAVTHLALLGVKNVGNGILGYLYKRISGTKEDLEDTKEYEEIPKNLKIPKN